MESIMPKEDKKSQDAAVVENAEAPDLSLGAAPQEPRQEGGADPSSAAPDGAVAQGMVMVVVPTAYKLLTDDRSLVDYCSGTYPMLKEHADHWWSSVNGVKPV